MSAKSYEINYMLTISIILNRVKWDSIVTALPFCYISNLSNAIHGSHMFQINLYDNEISFIENSADVGLLHLV